MVGWLVGRSELFKNSSLRVSGTKGKERKGKERVGSLDQRTEKEKRKAWPAVDGFKGGEREENQQEENRATGEAMLELPAKHNRQLK